MSTQTRFKLSPPPQTQSLQSTTFSPPMLDGSLTIPQMYDWHLQHTPNHRLFVYADENGQTRTIYWPEAVRAILTAARIIQGRVGYHIGNETPIVAILAASDTITYFTVTMGIMRANCIAFPISPRNSATAIAHLINRVGVTHVLVGHEQAVIDLANDALTIVQQSNPSTSPLAHSPVPRFEDLFLPPSDTILSSQDIPYERTDPDATIIILHSSGSTAFPKPIPWTNHRFCELALIPWFGERDLTDQIFSLHTMPMYHGMGVAQLCWTPSCGLVVGAFRPQSPAQLPTPDNLFRAAKATYSDIVFCVPAFIEAWSNNTEYVKWLASRGGVLYGGGPLNKAVGDYMTSQGVSIFILYGSTEGGIMSPILPAEVDYDWDYFKFPDLVTPNMVPHGNNTFEFVMVASKFCTPSVINTHVDGVPAYATSDLLIPHPTKPGYWKIYGRTDDQIMHNTGEKTNPGPLENILNQDPHVLASVMFGRGRFQAGMLIDPRPAFKFDPSDEVKLAEFRNAIWPTIEKMNNFAPQHSRLFKEMIIVAKPSKPFTYTAKSTARRQAIIQDYEDEINLMYDAVDESNQIDIQPPLSWDDASTIDFIRTVVNKVLVRPVLDDEDFFERGCDSLQATWIRNSLLRAVRDSAKIDTRNLTANFVYTHPSVAQLTIFISALVRGEDANEHGGTSRLANIDAMHAMALKYSQDFPRHTSATRAGSPQSRTTDVVLITGTTGSLGSYALSKLASCPDVSKIYALNRSSPGEKTLRERQKSALLDRGLDPALLDSKKVTFLEGDLLVEKFGLSDVMFKEIQKSVTHVIHNAWRVDFNLALTSFEPNVRGLRNLVDFSLSSSLPEPARFIYASSIGVHQSPSENEPLPESFVQAKVAVGSGYSESKWVSEKILSEAAAQTSLRPLIIRVGQLCGGLNGCWNINEWFPSIVQSTAAVGCFPDDEKSVSWVPVHRAAAALVDLRKAPETAKIVHMIHPRPVSWSSISSVISSELKVPLVPYAEWLSRLEHISSAGNEDRLHDGEHAMQLRALRLLPFYKSISWTHRGEAMGFPKLSSSLFNMSDADLPQLDGADVMEWLAYWRRANLLSNV